MGEVRVDSVTLESHIQIEELLVSAISGKPLEVSYVADGGNGAQVNVVLEPVTMDEVRELFLNDEMQARLESIGIRIKDLEEDN